MKNYIKWLLAAALVILPVQSHAWMGLMIAGGGTPAASSCAGDFCEDFEDGTSYGNDWTETDTSSEINRVTSSPSPHGGSYSLLTDPAGVGVYTTRDFAADKDNIEIDFWFYVQDNPTSWQWQVITNVRDSSGFLWDTSESWCSIYYDDNDVRFRCSTSGADGVAIENLTPDTWYLAKLNINRNASSSYSIYDTSLSQVGSTQTWTMADFPARYFSAGIMATIRGTPAWAMDDYEERYQ